MQSNKVKRAISALKVTDRIIVSFDPPVDLGQIWATNVICKVVSSLALSFLFNIDHHLAIYFLKQTSVHF